MRLATFSAILGIALAAPVLGATSPADNSPRLSDSELFRLEDRYETGTYLAMGGVLAGGIAAITHDRLVALGFYGGSVALRFGGLPLLGVTAPELCRVNGGANCESSGWDFFILSLGAECVLAYEMADLARDEYSDKPQNGVKVGAAIGAAGLSTLAYLYSWFRFREVRQRNDGGESRVSLALEPAAGEALGVTLRLTLPL